MSNFPTKRVENNPIGGRALAVTYRPIASLKLDPRNPRHHSRQQLRQIARSIEAFGFNVPVLVNADGKVIAGHGRLHACRELGLNEVPTICLEHLTEAQAKAFAIADNRLTENASWDDHLLAEQLKELSALDLSFDLDVTGFGMGEIDLRIEQLDQAPDPADTMLEAPSGPPVSKLGDLWQLGSHRVLCGSALDPSAYERLMQGEPAAMVFTDPPYNVPIDRHASGLGAVHHREFAMAAGEMSTAEFTDFLTQVCRLLARHSRDGALQYLCMDWRHLEELLAAGRKAYSEFLNLCVWVKHNAGMGSFYRSQHELVLVFKNGRARHRNNIELGRHGRFRTNIWQYPAINDFGRAGEEGKLLALHPTVKPVALVADAIKDCSARGELVLDAFLGSGTTVIAAERAGRRCFGIELDPLYVDTTVRRWQALSGEDALHADRKRSFDELQAEGASSHVE